MAKVLFFNVVHKDGLRFILPSLLLTILVYYLSFRISIVFGLFALWVIYFFRMPKRYLSTYPKIITAAADGKIVAVETVNLPREIAFTDKPVTKISTFLNIFDVHVNAIPVSGKIIDIQYHQGEFLNASFDKASEKNERNSIVIEYGDGKKLAVVQIAGLIARRIRCDVKVGDTVTQGQIFGLIRFGSRVDIYFDEEIQAFVNVGQRSRMIETILSTRLG